MRKVRWLVLVVAALGAAGCGPPLAAARRTTTEPPRPREREAAERNARRSCSASWSWLYPGIGQLCLHEPLAGVTFGTVTALDGAALIAAVADDDDGAALLAGTALADTYVYAGIAPSIERQLAARRRFVPADGFGEVWGAPFDLRVISRPEVWGGILGLAAVGSAFSIAVSQRDPHAVRSPPRLFGHETTPGVAYPLAGAAGLGLFAQVAPTEETVFRGLVQSAFARGCGEACGYLLGTTVFGASHAFNLVAIDDPDDRKRYAAVGLPIITMVGAYLGGIYWLDGYSLRPGVATHFWYDLLVSMAAYAYDPRHEGFATRVTLPLR